MIQFRWQCAQPNLPNNELSSKKFANILPEKKYFEQPQNFFTTLPEDLI